MPSADVYIGGWTDHAESGSTWRLTLTDNPALVVLTILAQLITLSLSVFWAVPRYVLYRAIPMPLQNHRHLKTINKDNCLMFTWKLCKSMGLARRNNRLSMLVMIWLLSVFYNLAYVGFPAIAAYLLTDTSTETPTVRTSSSTCNMFRPFDNNARSAVTQRNANLTLASSEYYQNCYQRSSPVDCQSNLVVDKLEWSQHEIECPFSPEVCQSTIYSRPARYETPFFPMHQLGINTKSKLQFRRGLSCGVLDSTHFNFPRPNADNGTTSTLSFGSPLVYKYDVRNLSIIAPGYQVTTIPQNALNDTDLDRRLQRRDGFVTVILLQAPGIYYPGKVNDSMFSAHQNRTFSSVGLRYSADNLVNVAACMDQYQICNNATGMCGDWESPESVSASSGRFLESEEDQLAWSILNYALPQTSIHYTISGRGASALLVQRSLYSQNQETIHQDQWKWELEAWFGISLAKLQLGIMSVGVRIPFLSTRDFENILDDPEFTRQRVLCRMIKLREGDFTNIHLPGFIATIVICTLLSLSGFVFNVLMPDLPQETGVALHATPGPSQANPTPAAAHQSPPQTPMIPGPPSQDPLHATPGPSQANPTPVAAHQSPPQTPMTPGPPSADPPHATPGLSQANLAPIVAHQSPPQTPIIPSPPSADPPHATPSPSQAPSS